MPAMKKRDAILFQMLHCNIALFAGCAMLFAAPVADAMERGPSARLKSFPINPQSSVEQHQRNRRPDDPPPEIVGGKRFYPLNRSMITNHSLRARAASSASRDKIAPKTPVEEGEAAAAGVDSDSGVTETSASAADAAKTAPGAVNPGPRVITGIASGTPRESGAVKGRANSPSGRSTGSKSTSSVAATSKDPAQVLELFDAYDPPGQNKVR